jgi:hypothetical protein
MLPNDIKLWTKAEPFKPFRIVMNAGGTYDVPHPELVAVGVDSLIYFTLNEEQVYTAAKMLGLQLVDRIELLDPPAAGQRPVGKGQKK